MTKFKIQNNTDTVDIDQKSIGLDSWIEGDSINLLNTNRGLHIQIRHNRDKDTFEAANKLASLLAEAPRMLKLLESFQKRELCDADQINETHSENCEGCEINRILMTLDLDK